MKDVEGEMASYAAKPIEHPQIGVLRLPPGIARLEVMDGLGPRTEDCSCRREIGALPAEKSVNCEPWVQVLEQAQPIRRDLQVPVELQQRHALHQRAARAARANLSSST